MYQPSSGLYGCPLAMTDGAAYLLQQWLKKSTTQDEETIKFVKEVPNIYNPGIHSFDDTRGVVILDIGSVDDREEWGVRYHQFHWNDSSQTPR